MFRLTVWTARDTTNDDGSTKDFKEILRRVMIIGCSDVLYVLVRNDCCLRSQLYTAGSHTPASKRRSRAREGSLGQRGRNLRKGVGWGNSFASYISTYYTHRQAVYG